MKYQLNINRYDLKCILIAIRSKYPDYQFAYFLNKSPLFLFKRMEKDLHYIINKKKVFFSTFKDLNIELQRSSFLIKNKSIYMSEVSEKNLFQQSIIPSTAFLIPELKKFDYFLKLKGVWKKKEITILKRFLNNLSGVESETNIELNTLKSINNLVF